MVKTQRSIHSSNMFRGTPKRSTNKKTTIEGAICFCRRRSRLARRALHLQLHVEPENLIKMAGIVRRIINTTNAPKAIGPYK